MTDTMGTDGAATAEVDLLSWDFIQDPYLTYREMRAGSGPRRLVIKTLGAGLRAWLVTEYDDVRRLLADPRLSKSAAGLPPIIAKHKVEDISGQSVGSDSMLFSDPPQHVRLRTMFGKAFTMRRVESLRPWIEEVTHRLLDGIVPGSDVDLVDTVAMSIPITVIGELLGVPRAAHDDLRAWNRTLTGVESEPPDKYRAYMASLEYFRGLVAQKIADHDTADDMINAMINLDGDEQFSESELLSTIFLMMNAGYETTANLISSSVHALLRHPDQQELLRADSGLIPNAIEEFLRYESPLNLSTLRYTVEPVAVGNTVIPADEVVFLALCSANRDPERFAEPDRLDVRRNANTHLAFGHGIHHCVGAPLARLEGEIVLKALLDRFPRWAAIEPLDGLPWRYSLQFRGLERLPMRLYTNHDDGNIRVEEMGTVSTEVITRFFDSSGAGDIDVAVDCFADDGQWIAPEGSGPGTVYTKGEIGDLITTMNKTRQEMIAMGVDGYFDPPVMFSENEALVRWTVRTTEGKVVGRGVDLFVLRDDKIVLKDVFRKA